MRHLKTVSLCVIFIISITTALSQGQDWPQWRGLNRDGKLSGFTAPKTWPKELSKKWTLAVGTGDSSPVLAGNKLYTFGRMDINEVITCIDITSGKEIWHDSYPAQFVVTGPSSRHPGTRSTPVIADGRLCTLGVGGILSCLDAATGKMFWDSKNATITWPGGIQAQSGPAVAYGKVYFGGGYGINAVSETTGELLSHYHEGGAYFGSPPAVSNGLVFAATNGGSPVGGNAIYALKATDLSLQWVNHTPENTAFESSPVVANGVLYITSNRQNQATKGFLYAINAQNGAPRWQFHLPGGGTTSTPAVIDGVVYFGQWWQGFLAIGTQHKVTLTSPDGGENWKRNTDTTIRWVYNATPMPCANVQLDLMKGGVLNRAINASTPIGARGSGTYTWKIPLAAPAGANYQVRITCGAYTDLSNDYFTISV